MTIDAQIQFALIKQTTYKTAMISRITNNIINFTKFASFTSSPLANTSNPRFYSISYSFSLHRIKRSSQGKIENPLQSQTADPKRTSRFKAGFKYVKKEFKVQKGVQETDGPQFDMAIYHKINKKIKQTVTLKQLFYYYDHNIKKMHPSHHAKAFTQMVSLKVVNRKSLVQQKKIYILQNEQVNQKQQTNRAVGTQGNFEKVIQNVIKHFDQIPPQSLAQTLLSYTRLKFHELKISKARKLLKLLLTLFNNKENIQVTQVYKCMKLIIGLNRLKDKIRTTEMVQYNTAQQVLKKLVMYVTAKALNFKTSVLCELIDLSNQNSKIASSGFIRQIVLQLLKRSKTLSLRTLLNIEIMVFNQQRLMISTMKVLQQTKSPQFNFIVRIQSYITKKLYSQLKSEHINTRVVISHLQNIRKLQQKHIAIINRTLFQMKINQQNQKSQSDSKKAEIDPSFNLVTEHLKSITKALYEIHQKYLFEAYSDEKQKQTILNWINKNHSFVSQFFQVLKQTNLIGDYQSIRKNSDPHQSHLHKALQVVINNPNFALQKQVRRLINLLCQFYSQLNFDTQLAVLVYVLEKNYANRTHIAQIFVERLVERKFFNISLSNSIRLLQLLLIPEINVFFSKSNEGYKWVNPLFRYIFLNHKLFTKTNALEYLSLLISQVLSSDKNYLQLFVKRYTKFSFANRFFNKTDVQMIQKFRKKVFEKVIRVRNSSEDHQYLDIDQKYEEGSSWELRHKIYKKITNCIGSFELMMKTFSKIDKQVAKQSINHENPLKSSRLKQVPLFKEILINFQDQLRYSLFQELITYQSIEKMIQIQDQLDYKFNIKVINFYRQKFEKQRESQNEVKDKSNISSKAN